MTGWELEGNDNDKEPKRRMSRVIWVIFLLLYQLYTSINLNNISLVVPWPGMGLGPTGFIKPVPVPIKTRTCGCGYGFQRVWVRVAQKNPRVARDNPY